jgi:hypothetical protein
MKNIYAAPALILSGEVIRDTKGGAVSTPDAPGEGSATGSVGFYL